MMSAEALVDVFRCHDCDLAAQDAELFALDLVWRRPHPSDARCVRKSLSVAGAQFERSTPPEPSTSPEPMEQ